MANSLLFSDNLTQTELELNTIHCLHFREGLDDKVWFLIRIQSGSAASFAKGLLLQSFAKWKQERREILTGNSKGYLTQVAAMASLTKEEKFKLTYEHLASLAVKLELENSKLRSQNLRLRCCTIKSETVKNEQKETANKNANRTSQTGKHYCGALMQEVYHIRTVILICCALLSRFLCVSTLVPNPLLIQSPMRPQLDAIRLIHNMSFAEL